MYKDMKENKTRDELKHEFMRQLLDSYFMSRRPLPEQGYMRENKTTQQIVQELAPMMAIPADDIVEYMLEHDFSTFTEGDGSVSWTVWREMISME